MGHPMRLDRRAYIAFLWLFITLKVGAKIREGVSYGSNAGHLGLIATEAVIWHLELVATGCEPEFYFNIGLTIVHLYFSLSSL